VLTCDTIDQAIERDSGEPVGDRVAHVVEVRRTALDDGSEAGNRVARGRHGSCDDRQFNRSSHPVNRWRVDPACLGGGDRTTDQRVGDVTVPPGCHDP